jgi:hypothetical protein
MQSDLVLQGVLLSPLVIQELQLLTVALGFSRHVDRLAGLTASNPKTGKSYKFSVHERKRSTPQEIREAIHAVKDQPNSPLIRVPYLSPERLAELETLGISGVDWCGNGVIALPDLYILRTGHRNRYKDSRPLSDPFKGRSAMVARALECNHYYNSIADLRAQTAALGESLSLPQVSKAVETLKQESIVGSRKQRDPIKVIDTLRLRDGLCVGWASQPGRITRRVGMRCPDWAERLPASEMSWAVTGTSSASRFYRVLGEGGPVYIAVWDFEQAVSVLGGGAAQEPIPSFADVVLLETASPGYYFNNTVASSGVRWSSRLQAYLELSNGDARQQQAARELYQ